VSAALAAAAFVIASAAPDGIEKVLANSQTMQRATAALPAILPNYQFGGIGPEWARRGAAGLVGVAIALAVSAGIGKILSRKRTGASGGA
jgi:hypothetical protein